MDEYPNRARNHGSSLREASHDGQQATSGAAHSKFLLRVEEVAELLDISRTRVYDLIRTGELQSLKIGGSRRVPSTAVQVLVDRLLRGAPG